MYCMGSREGSAVGEYEFYHFFDIHVRARGSQDAELSAREQEETRKLLRWRRTGPQCTCFTRTNAQILTPEELQSACASGVFSPKVPSLLALLVQKYKY